MKRTMSAVLLVGLLLVFCSGCRASKWNDGTFSGTGTGYGGPIKAEVTISKGKISKVEAVEHAESPDIGGAAIEKISADVVKAQKAEVDSVSGATATSEGYIQGIKEALSKAEKK
ncbi:MAG TPA: FMN-binding protein [Firmicutes bacterium]|nr:FMN-binding protein [Candidatus Fermentithermobacillaceae bacterium]